MQRLLISLVFVFAVSCRAFAQEPQVWTNWRDANLATDAALKDKDYPLAEKAAKTAAILYPEQVDEFDAKVYLVLVDNAFQMVFTNTKSPKKMWQYLGPRLEYLLDRGDSVPEMFIDLGLYYAQVYLSAPLVTTQKELMKEKADLIRRIEDATGEVLPATHPKVSLARYFTLMAEKNFRGKRKVRGDFSAHLDKTISLEHTDAALRTLSALAGIMTSRFQDHEEAIELIKTKTELIGVENVPKARREALFTVVAAAAFLDGGPEKAEALINSAEVLQAPALAFDEDGDVKLQPIKRYEPFFRNITSKKLILLSFTVNRKGRPENIKILNSDLNKPNEDAAVSAVKKWRYLPAFEDGRFKAVEGVRVAFTVQPP